MISGGTMSGYCDVGSVSIDTAPTMTVITAITMATIGRRIKNLDKDSPRSRRAGSSNGRFFRNLVRAHRHAFLQLLHVTCNHALIGLQSGRDDPVIARLRPQRDIHDV